MSKLFKDNRKSFAKEMDKGSVYIAFAGKAPIRTADQFYPFCPNRSFYYLTGIKDPVIMLVLQKDEEGEVTETLYLERYDELVAKWDGAVLNKEKAQELSGIEKYREIEQFEPDMGRLFFGANRLKVYLDLENRYFDTGRSPAHAFAKKVIKNHPHAIIENVNTMLYNLRMIKSKPEIKLIKKACDITGEAIKIMMRESKPGMPEYEYLAHFDFHLSMNGAKRAFGSIAAGGKNATILHYKENSERVKDGDLILFDLGAECDLYAADISRTFPVNGKFTARQKELYNIVLKAQLKVIEKMKPGVKWKDMNDMVIDFYAKELKNIGLIKGSDKEKLKEEVKKYYYHGIGHHLGLDVHDGKRGNDDVLKKGMVYTVEPGLYIAEENIGIRIEDDVLVTDKGSEVLSAGIPKTVEEIEALMSPAPAAAAKRVSRK